MTELLRKFTVDLIRKTINMKPRYVNENNVSGLAIHQPMMIYSLFYMGATQNRLQEASDINLSKIPQFNRNYTQVPGFVVSESNFMDNFGKDEYYLNYLDYFQKQLNSFPSSEAYLKHFINKIPSLVYTDAFHCLIRLGFLLDMNLIEGLPSLFAYASTGHFDLIKVDPKKKPLTVQEMIKKILQEADRFSKIKYPTFLITYNMQQLLQDDVIRSIFSHPLVYEGEKTYKEVLEFLIKTYWLNDNFTTLHAFNSSLPLQQVLPMMEDQQSVFQLYFQGLMIALITSFPMQNYQNLLERFESIKVADKLPSFENIFEEIIKSDDEHKAKTVYALHKQHLKNPENGLFHQKAAFNANLI